MRRYDTCSPVKNVVRPIPVRLALDQLIPGEGQTAARDKGSRDGSLRRVRIFAAILRIGVYLLGCIEGRMEEEAVRWNIKVSKETDLTLRTYLGSQGMKKGDLSKFIEEAVRWRVFHRTVQSIKEQNADTDPGELQRLIDTAARQVRAEQGAKGKARKA
jgi:hypothetical protein